MLKGFEKTIEFIDLWLS